MVESFTVPDVPGKIFYRNIYLIYSRNGNYLQFIHFCFTCKTGHFSKTLILLEVRQNLRGIALGSCGSQLRDSPGIKVERKNIYRLDSLGLGYFYS